MRKPARPEGPFDFYPFIVAEMGANHMGDLKRALAIVGAAQAAGADAVKLQTFTADSMVARGAKHRIKGGLWEGQDLWELYEKCAMPWDWHEVIFNEGKHLGIPIFSTPFDVAGLTFLERLGCPMYKIASFEILDIGLIGAAAQTGKPVVISTGMASLHEIDIAVEAYWHGGGKQDNLTLLKCTSAYPAPPEYSNLATIASLRKHFGCQVGFSDHTRGIGAAVAAALEGADMIEKHMGFYRQGGPDAHFSVDPIGMESLVESVRQAMDAIGGGEQFGPVECEEPMLALRRTLHVKHGMAKGEQLRPEDIVALRPAGGLPPKDRALLIGTTVNRDVEPGEPLTWDMVRSEPRV